jgi:hypothetical protein
MLIFHWIPWKPIQLCNEILSRPIAGWWLMWSSRVWSGSLSLHGLVLRMYCISFSCPILCWCCYPEMGTSSIDWVRLSRLLPEDGDRIRSPRCFKYRRKRWIMCKNSIIVLRYHHYKLLDFTLILYFPLISETMFYTRTKLQANYSFIYFNF